MKFSEEQTHEVKLHHREYRDLGDARLTFGGNLMGVVATLRLLSVRSRSTENNRRMDFVGATAGNGHVFTLFDCTLHGLALTASFLLSGSVNEDRFSSIAIRYSDISEWFLRPQPINGDVGRQLTWTSPPEHFTAEITEQERRFKLSSQTVGSREWVGEDLIVHEHVEFVFECMVGDFSIVEVREKATGLCSLLSPLIAYPISVICVVVRTQPGQYQYLYFGTFERLERDTTRDFSIQCFIRKKRLDGQWPSVLCKFYDDRKRRDLWVRLAGMQRYKGFWDFKLLGYVSLLDRCVEQRSQSLKDGVSPPSTSKIRTFGKKLCGVSPKFDTKQLNAIVALANQIFVSSEPSFPNQYAYAMDATDSDVKAVINLSDEDFDLIKDVRDRIAHGMPPDVPQRDSTRISAIIGKISLVLTYWMFQDLGIPKDVFLSSMNTTHNRLRFEAGIDDKSLARAIGSATFFIVSAEKFEVLSLQTGLILNACLIEGPPGEIEFSAEYTSQRQGRMQQGLFNWESIFDVEVGAVKHHGAVYIESGDRSLQLHSVCIFDKSKLRLGTIQD